MEYSEHCGPKLRVGCSVGLTAKKRQNERDILSEHIFKKGCSEWHVTIKMESEVNFLSCGGNLSVCENENEIVYILSATQNVNPLKSLYSYYCN